MSLRMNNYAVSGNSPSELNRVLKLIEADLSNLLGVGQNVVMKGGKVTGISPGTQAGEALTIGSGATGLETLADGLKIKTDGARATELTTSGLGVKVDGKTIKINANGQLFVALATQAKLKESGKSDDAGLMVDDEALATSDGSGLLSAADKIKLDTISSGADAITVNGTAVIDADFDNTTPAAPSNAQNVKWQKDSNSPCNISAYVDRAVANALASLDSNAILVEAVQRIVASTTALTATEGYLRWDSTRKLQIIYDGQRERGITPIGWLPFVFPQGGEMIAGTTALTLPAAGGCVATPIVMSAPMLLESLVVRNNDTTTERTWNWYIYEQYLNNGNSAENSLARVAYGSAETFTPVGASVRIISAVSGPVFLAPGVYWLVIQNQHATSDWAQGSTATTVLGMPMCKTKTITNPPGTTLDFVSETWSNNASIIAVRLNGRVFGQTSRY